MIRRPFIFSFNFQWSDSLIRIGIVVIILNNVFLIVFVLVLVVDVVLESGAYDRLL
jgi:phage shock protein PspC (stress-responsive transcriptional regulator)